MFQYIFHQSVFLHILHFYAFQVPVVPLQRPDEMYASSQSWAQTASGYEDMCTEQGIPTMITWSYDGNEVAVEGSWDDWRTRFQKFGAFFFLHFHFLNCSCA